MIENATIKFPKAQSTMVRGGSRARKTEQELLL
jgi:hypothetical protein